MDVFFLTPGCEIIKVFNEIADHIISKPQTKRGIIIEGIVLVSLNENIDL